MNSKVKKIYLRTFGCQMNERDSEIMAQSLAGYGYVEGMDMHDADLVILNTCSIRAKAEQKALKILDRSLPESGGFLEAIPLTAFVALSLIHAGLRDSIVVDKGIAFLKRTQREDGSWPIDVDLSTWVTTLSVKALGNRKNEVLSETQQKDIVNHLLSVQNKSIHPFNGTSPGGWGWTNY